MLLNIILTICFILSMLLMIFTATAFIQDKKGFGSAPNEIQAVIQPKPERFMMQHLLGWCLLVTAIIMISAVGIISIWDGVKKGYGFLQFFIRFTAIFEIYKIFDMIFIDYFLLIRSNFFQHYFPETTECKSKLRYGFNLKSQITKLIVFPIASAIAAWLCALIFK